MVFSHTSTVNGTKSSTATAATLRQGGAPQRGSTGEDQADWKDLCCKGQKLRDERRRLERHVRCDFGRHVRPEVQISHLRLQNGLPERVWPRKGKVERALFSLEGGLSEIPDVTKHHDQNRRRQDGVGPVSVEARANTLREERKGWT